MALSLEHWEARIGRRLRLRDLHVLLTVIQCGSMAKAARQLSVSQPAISKHLSILENAGLVWREKRGQNVHYGLNEDALTGTIAHFLAEVCPRSRPFRKESAAAAQRKKGRQPG